MKSGDADVVQALDLVAERFRDHRRFLGNRKVARAGGNHEQAPDQFPRLAAREVHDARERVPAHRAVLGVKRLGLGLAGARAEERAVRVGEAAADPGDLLDGLAFAEDHLRLPLPQSPVMVDGGVGERFGWKMAKPGDRVRSRQPSGCDLAEQRLELGRVHATRASGVRYSVKIASACPIDSTWKSRWRRSLAP